MCGDAAPAGRGLRVSVGGVGLRVCDSKSGERRAAVPPPVRHQQPPRPSAGSGEWPCRVTWPSPGCGSGEAGRRPTWWSQWAWGAGRGFLSLLVSRGLAFSAGRPWLGVWSSEASCPLRERGLWEEVAVPAVTSQAATVPAWATLSSSTVCEGLSGTRPPESQAPGGTGVGSVFGSLDEGPVVMGGAGPGGALRAQVWSRVPCTAQLRTLVQVLGETDGHLLPPPSLRGSNLRLYSEQRTLAPLSSRVHDYWRSRVAALGRARSVGRAHGLCPSLQGTRRLALPLLLAVRALGTQGQLPGPFCPHRTCASSLGLRQVTPRGFRGCSSAPRPGASSGGWGPFRPPAPGCQAAWGFQGWPGRAGLRL